MSREPICRTCNHDPVNRLAEKLRDIADGVAEPDGRDAFIDELIDGDRGARDLVDKLLQLPVSPSRARPIPNRTIPVTAV